jgi:hypothetical protein
MSSVYIASRKRFKMSVVKFFPIGGSWEVVKRAVLVAELDKA